MFVSLSPSPSSDEGGIEVGDFYSQCVFIDIGEQTIDLGMNFQRSVREFCCTVVNFERSGVTCSENPPFYCLKKDLNPRKQNI